MLSLKDDQEVLRMQISLFKLRFIVLDILQLNPFMELIEKQLNIEFEE